MEYIIDRFEGEFAICEDKNKKIIQIKKTDIPQNAKEGDVLKLDGEKFIIDTTATEKRRNKNFDLLNKLLNS